MAEINTYGLPVNGLEEAAKDIKEIRALGRDHYYQLFYDKDNGDVWVDHHYDFTHNTFTRYRDPDVIEITSYIEYPTPEHIAEVIKIQLEKEAYFSECGY